MEITKIHSLLFLVYSILILVGFFIPLVARRKFKLSWVTIAFVLMFNKAFTTIVLLIDPASYSLQFNLMLMCMVFEVLCCAGVNIMEKFDAKLEAQKARDKELFEMLRNEENRLLLEKRRLKKM